MQVSYFNILLIQFSFISTIYKSIGRKKQIISAILQQSRQVLELENKNGRIY